MRIQSFAQGIAFAACTALAWLPVELLMAPVLGASVASRLYLGASVGIFLWLLRPAHPGRRSITLILASLGIGASLCAPSLVGASAGLTATVGFAQLLCTPGRANPIGVLTELGIGVGALALAGYLIDDSQTGRALAVWGYFLVQSVHVLVNEAVHDATDASADPFEVASRATREILESR